MKPFKEFKWSNAWKGSPDTYNTINLNLAAALILIAIFLGLNIAIFLKERKQAEQREQYFKEFE